MTILPGSRKALIVIDAQNVILKDCYERDLKVAKISEAIVKARAAALPVIWIQHSDEDITVGSQDWKIVPELAPISGENIIGKHFRSSFVDTELHEKLQELGVGHILVCGAESNNCVRHTIHSALDLGYDVTLLQDAHTAVGFEWNGFKVDAPRVIDEQNTNFMSYQLPGRRAESRPVAEASF
jgi:nicotinamidase-related amidase